MGNLKDDIYAFSMELFMQYSLSLILGLLMIMFQWIVN